MGIDLNVNIARLRLNNPVMVASGTFGYAQEFKDIVDLKKIGAIVTKSITLYPRQGNPPPRTCETPAGLLNSIGLENPGLKAFIRDKLPFLKKIRVPIIVSIASEKSPDDFIEISKRLDIIGGIAAIELNISCPNIKGGLIAQDAKVTYEVVKSVRRVSHKTLIAKLSPNVTDIVSIAKSAEAAGADAVSLVNTFQAMAIDIETMTPKLGSVTGGLSGPAIKPIALKMVWDVARAIKIPVIGMGGIVTASDALEFFIAGATAVSVGTANFINPDACIEIIKGVKLYLKSKRLNNIHRIIGKMSILKGGSL